MKNSLRRPKRPLPERKVKTVEIDRQENDPKMQIDQTRYRLSAVASLSVVPQKKLKLGQELSTQLAVFTHTYTFDRWLRASM